jgi:hypothetical protein
MCLHDLLGKWDIDDAVGRWHNVHHSSPSIPGTHHQFPVQHYFGLVFLGKNIACYFKIMVIV